MKNYCIDCKKELKDYRNLRCQKCNLIFRYKNRKQFFCIDCHKELNRNGKAIRCKSCAKKGNKIALIDGRSLLKHTCKDCGKEIWYTSIRCKKCAKQGEFHPQFGKKRTKETKSKLSLVRGGTGLPYEKNEYPNNFYAIRELIRKRDNYSCQICYRKGNFVHHIDYNKKNCKEKNLITLCHKCHSKTNFNRENWIIYFS